MNDAQLARIQDEIMASVVKDVDIEAMAKETAAKVAIDLAYKNKPITIEFPNEDSETRVLTFRSRRVTTPNFKPALLITVADVENFKRIGAAYRPYIVTVEINHNYTHYESLKLAINRFLRHFSGNPVVEELES